MRSPAVFFVLALAALAGFVLSPAILGGSLAYPFYRNTFFGLVLFNLIGLNGAYLNVVLYCLVHMIVFGAAAPLILLALKRGERPRVQANAKAGAGMLAAGSAILLVPFALNASQAGLTGSALVINIMFLFPFALGVSLHAFFLFPAAARALLRDRVPPAVSTALASLTALGLIWLSYRQFTGITLPAALIPAGLFFALAQRMVANKAVVFACFFPALFMAMLPQKEAIIVPIGSLTLTFLADFNAAMLALSHLLRHRPAPAA